jgi:hypothetical protein
MAEDTAYQQFLDGVGSPRGPPSWAIARQFCMDLYRRLILLGQCKLSLDGATISFKHKNKTFRISCASWCIAKTWPPNRRNLFPERRGHYIEHTCGEALRRIDMIETYYHIILDTIEELLPLPIAEEVTPHIYMLKEVIRMLYCNQFR